MSEVTERAIAGNLPVFITAPGEVDVLLYVMGVVLVGLAVGLGILYFRLHALPEHIAHRGQKVQFEIVCVLALLAMFTHNHAYWIAALLLAFVEVPDFTTPLRRMGDSLAKIAGRSPSRQTDIVARTDQTNPD